MTDVSRLLRGTLPFLAALPVATVFALPASAAQPVAAAQPARSAEWWLAALRVSQAWQAAPAEGKGVTVAVLSTGVDTAHRDLSGAVTAGPDYSASGRAARGPFWGFEGTAVASLIAGHGHGAHGAAGITGVAPGARILSVRVTLEYNDPLNAGAAITRRLPGAIAAGIRYAVAHGAGVIALPLDPGTLGPAASGDPAAAGGSMAERTAVSYALGHGVVLIAPAGDNGASTRTVNYPAAYPGVVAVGATAKNGGLTPFTSTRAYVALTAPGSGLTTAAPGGGYDSLASTDMSSALTAGVAALIRSRFPRLSATQVAQALERGTTARPRAHPAPGSGHGALDAAAAVTAAAAIAAAPGPSPERAARPAHPRGTPRHPARDRAAGHGHGDLGRVGAAGRGHRGLRADRRASGRARGDRRPAPPHASGTLAAGPAHRPGRQPRPAPGDRHRRAAGGAATGQLAASSRRRDHPHNGRAHAADRPHPRQAQGDRRAAVGARGPAADRDAGRPADGPAGRADGPASGVRPVTDQAGRAGTPLGAGARRVRRRTVLRQLPGLVAVEHRPDVRVEPGHGHRPAARPAQRRRGRR